MDPKLQSLNLKREYKPNRDSSPRYWFCNLYGIVAWEFAQPCQTHYSCRGKGTREVTIGWIEVMFLGDEGLIFVGLDGVLKVQLDEVRVLDKGIPLFGNAE